jgi:DNA-binding MarR family transcriptional regulator
LPAAPRTTLDAGRLRLALMRISRRLRQQADAGITPSQLSALATLDRSGPLALRDLAAAERVTSSTLTRIVAALESEHLITRITDPHDRRCNLVSVTPAGAELLTSARDKGTRLLADRVDALSPHDADILAAALPVLESLLEEER